MHLAVVHLHGSTAHLVSETGEEETGAHETVSKDPGPIIPELKELYWGAGAFIVFALLMRFVLFPKVKKGMASLLDNDRLDLPDFAGRLRAWARDGYMAVGGVLFDVRIQTGRALRALDHRATLRFVCFKCERHICAILLLPARC